jgi:hypothetical protein
MSVPAGVISTMLIIVMTFNERLWSIQGGVEGGRETNFP